MSLIAATGCLTHGVLQAVSAAQFWRVCFTEHFDSPACLFQQYEAVTPWWQYSVWPWVVEMAIAVLVLAAAAWARQSAWLAWAAFGAVALSNVVTDYLVGPIINGGYTSADSAPGVGFFGAGMLCFAGVLYLMIGVRAASATRRHADQPDASPLTRSAAPG